MSLNDPQWGKRPEGGGGGPPDLDEIWRNVNRRINDLFNRKSGGSSEGSGGDGRRSLLPMSGAGKILKRELRRPFWENQDRRVA